MEPSAIDLPLVAEPNSIDCKYSNDPAVDFDSDCSATSDIETPTGFGAWTANSQCSNPVPGDAVGSIQVPGQTEYICIKEGTWQPSISCGGLEYALNAVMGCAQY